MSLKRNHLLVLISSDLLYLYILNGPSWGFGHCLKIYDLTSQTDFDKRYVEHL